jgi:predicted SAM-dependent methyltransferase
MSSTEAPTFSPLADSPAIRPLGRLGTAAYSAKRALRTLVGTKAYEGLARLRPRRSETSRQRALLAPYCTGYGLDIGFGGDAITTSAIRMDLPSPYTNLGRAPVQLGGDCRALDWWRDGALDYVYSSHVLEDFPEAETAAILREWTRVLKPGGHLILLLPDQQRYLAYCRRVGEVDADGVIGNAHHSIAHFSLAYLDGVAESVGNLCQIASHPSLGHYSFAVVYEKIA